MSKKTAKKIRVGLQVTWLVFLVVLLILIQYAEANIAAQGFVTILVKLYLWGSFVVVAIMEWLRRKTS